MQEVMCSRTDCEFFWCGKCGYGGEAINISADGCDTYEPASDDVIFLRVGFVPARFFCFSG